jgi:hypothetical protein
VRCQVLTAASVNMTVLWDVAQCCPTDVSETSTAAIIRNMSQFLLEYTAQYCRKRLSLSENSSGPGNLIWQKKWIRL